MTRTRIKICGLTRAIDVTAAVDAGADAVGFVCYAASPRFVDAARLRELGGLVPAYVTPVLLFVNAPPAEIESALIAVPNALLQFHGDESEADCSRYGRAYVRAIRMSDDADLTEAARCFSSAVALQADTAGEGFGGTGKTFDWDRIPSPKRRSKPLILSGGLTPVNVGRAIVRNLPFAVDVSSGVEASRGIKSRDKLSRFVAAVRAADKQLAEIWVPA